MKKRILTLLAVVCLLSAVLSGCGGGSQTGTTENTDQSTTSTPADGPEARAAAGELNVGIAQDLDSSLDPHKTVKAGTREVMFNVFEGLLKPDASGNLNPAVAPKAPPTWRTIPTGRRGWFEFLEEKKRRSGSAGGAAPGPGTASLYGTARLYATA